MSNLKRVVVSVVVLCLAGSAVAQQRTRTRPATRDIQHPNIVSIVRQIDAKNIERDIRQLAAFGTRNTLSEQNDPKRGIGAARDWLYAEFLKAAEASNGRMTVEKQSYEQTKAPRIPQPTVITNIVATLKGSQPESTDRLYVVSGHYDSMCNSPTDAKCDAPGANDDASGTAAVLEMARVMAKFEFDATIVFMAVAGEEQSLLGSTYFAEQAKQKNWNIEAMLTNDIIGNTLGGNGMRNRNTVRVFSEGVPSNETAAEANIRRSVGGENDSPSRQLARFIKDTSAGLVPQMNVMMVYRRDRYGRGGDHIPFLERGYPAVRFTETNEDFRHQHQNVRVENGIQYGDLPQFVDFAYVANVARVNAAAL
ncbi:MAG TPA: M20/M25/M40 family metallo-hydrolase, partial [Pyrinomonadaceae bacterium]|nr:M20/M25/M40 family metallo-hydrolase [Pyrinomonadaceae bacterium]